MANGPHVTNDLSFVMMSLLDRGSVLSDESCLEVEVVPKGFNSSVWKLEEFLEGKTLCLEGRRVCGRIQSLVWKLEEYLEA